MPLELIIDRLDQGSAVLTLSGPLTLGTNMKIVDSNVQQLVSSGCNRLIVDLSACPYADSSGLGFLIHASGLAAEHGGALRLCGVTERVVALLAMTKTDAILPCDADRRQSIANLPASGSEA